MSDLKVPPAPRLGRNFALRLVLAIPLILAGVIKLGAASAFRKSLEAGGLFPAVLAEGIAVALPPFELLCGILLLINYRTRAIALAVTGLMLGFSVFAVISLWRETTFDCGCFGALTWLNWPPPAALARNLILLVFAAVLYRRELKSS